MNAVKSEVELFSFEDQQVRTVTKGDETWFVLKDVCDVLELRTDKAKERLNSEDVDNHLSKGVIPTRGRPLLMVNESGLYDVILDSRKPQAKRFRRWVTSEVLPSIRKHGGYLTESKIEEALLNPDVLIQLAQNLKNEQEKRIIAEAERAAIEALKDKVETENKVLAPKAKRFDKIVAAEGSHDFNRVAKNLGIGRNRMLAALRDRGVLMKAKGMENVPYQQYAHHFDVKIREGTTWHGVEYTSYTTRVKPSGIVLIGNKLADLIDGWDAS